MEIPNIILPEKLREVLITRTAIKELQSPQVVEEVISFQFEDIIGAMRTHCQVEMSGFGKFLVSSKKTQKRLLDAEKIKLALQAQLNKSDLSETQRKNYQKKMEYTIANIEYLKTRRNGYEN